MEKRKAFNFLRSYYDVLEDIHTDKDKLTYLMAILDKQFKGIEPELTGIPRLCYNGQRHAIDKSVEGWESKTKQKLYDPTEGGYEGGSQDPYEDPTEGPMVYPSGDSVMTTEDPYQDPSVQEQEQEQEQEKEKEQEEVKKKFYAKNKIEIEYIRDLTNCSTEEAIDIAFNTINTL